MKWPKLNSIDPEERYHRVFDFMNRNSRYYSCCRSLKFHENFIKDDSPYVKENMQRFLKDIEDCKIAKNDAYKRRIELTHKVLKEMSEGIINNTTQGIWLSYPHSKELVKIDDNKDKYFILTLCTGEKFYAYKKWIEYNTPRAKYDYFNSRWIKRKPIHKRFYSKLKILYKL